MGMGMLSLGVLEITVSSWAAPGHRMTICLASLGSLLRISVGRYSAGRGRLAPELRYQLGESEGCARLRAADPAGRDAGEVRHATGGGEAGRVAPGPPDRLLCFPKQALPLGQRTHPARARDGLRGLRIHGPEHGAALGRTWPGPGPGEMKAESSWECTIRYECEKYKKILKKNKAPKEAPEMN